MVIFLPDLENLLNIETEVTQVLSDLGVNEKLAEMDDFMNQNELKVEITNENAVTTGLVTYTCTVKDKNNNLLSGRVVEWYKGTTLIGVDATDNNGVSTFSHRVSEADIYDVHAVVRGTHAGDDIRMFVKDKNNILSMNLWSGGAYLHNITDIYNNTSREVSVSNDWSSKGDESFLWESTSTVTDLFRITNSYTGNYILKMDVYNPTSEVTIIFFNRTDNQSRVTVPKSNEVTQIQLSLKVVTTSYLSCRINIPQDSVSKFYCDNISIMTTQ